MLPHVSLSTGGAERLLLLSALGGTRHSWRILVDTLGRRYECVSIEYPGFGGAAMRPIEGVEHMGRLVSETLAQLPPKPLHIVGYSFGGWIAQQLAVDERFQVRSLTLIGSSDRAYQIGIQLAQGWLDMLHALGLRHALAQLGLWTLSPQLLEKRPSTLAAFVEGMLGASAEPRAYEQLFKAILSYRKGVDLTRIQARTLVIRGEVDALCPRMCSEPLLQGIGNCQYLEVPAAAHSLVWEYPDVLLRALASQLEPS